MAGTGAEGAQEVEIEVGSDEDLTYEIVDDPIVSAGADDDEDDETPAPAAKKLEAEEEEEDDEPALGAAELEPVEISEDPDEFVEDEEFQSYSKRVKKRIKTLWNENVAAKREAETIKTQATEVITRFRNEGAAVVETLKSREKEYDDLQDAYAKLLEQSLVDREERIIKEMADADESLDSAAKARLQHQLQTLMYQKNQLREISTSLPSQRKAREEKLKPWESTFVPVQQQATQQGGQQATQPQPATQLGQQWKTNRKWYGRPGYEAETIYAHTIDEKLVRSGKNPNSPEYFAALDREIAKKFPALYKVRPKPGSQTVAGVPAGGASSAGSKAPAKGKVKLNRRDLEVMRNFGLDPNNPAHLKEYAAQKRA